MTAAKALRITTAALGLTAALALSPCSRAAGPGREAVLLTLGGEQHSGNVESLTPRAVRLSGRSDSRRFSTDEIHWLRFKGAQASLADEGLGRVELVSGSRLPVTETTQSGRDLIAAVAAPFAPRVGQSLRVPYEQVASIVFHVGPPGLADQWRRIRQTDATTDLIVVTRRDGQTLDYVEGIVTAIAADSIAVDLDGERVEVGRNRVYGIVCFRPQPGALPPLVRVLTRQGELRAEQVRLADTRLLVTLPIGEEIGVPLEAVETIDYSRGGVQLLSDLEPMAADWRPFFQPPGDLDLLQEWGRFRRDASYSGSPLTLRGGDGRPLHFAKGLAIRSHGEVTYAVPAGFAWLRATVGLDPAPRIRSDAQLRVIADGQQILARGFAAGDPPFDLELPIAGVGSITLVVDYGANADAGDNLHLGNARFTK